MAVIGSQGDLFQAQLLQLANEVSVNVPAAQATNQQLRLGSGRFIRVLVTVVGSTATTIYDNASNNTTGLILGIVPANSTVGTIIVFNFVCALGIVVAGAATNAGLTVGYM